GDFLCCFAHPFEDVYLSWFFTRWLAVPFFGYLFVSHAAVIIQRLSRCAAAGSQAVRSDPPARAQL
ncbi:hypothetical protein, partial [Erwinia amylovora]|uniref:hypothetical protein n=1 Tax=Erwinia amylovora TaxID=552 RepID=UPI0038559076